MKDLYSPETILSSANELLRKYCTFSEKIELSIDTQLKDEEYSVDQNGENIKISGGTAQAVVFGAGRLIREPHFRGKSAPDKPFRGIYFATHFGNWYDNAAEEEIDLYLENLVIWGCNTIKVWFDRHQFRNIMETAAQKKLKNLKYILRKCARLGMKNFLTSLANEAYAGSPADLRADWVGLKNGYKTATIAEHYHVELCPSKPGSVDLLIHWHEELLDAFSDVPIHYFEIFCYDQGGCTCPECAPYGANGYWKLIPAISELIRKKVPECKIVLSTWRFDCFTDGEWEYLRRNTEKLHQYADMLSVDNYDLKNLKTVQDNIPAMGFTDISMGGELPWGGFGVNPAPTFLDTFRKEERLCGNSAYSEGIYEDMNKIILLGIEWDTNCSAFEMLRKYAAFYFGEQSQEFVAEAAELMEQNMGHSAIINQGEEKHCAYFTDKTDPEKPWTLTYECPKICKDKAEKCLHLVNKAELYMNDEQKKSWRWRLFRLRAEIDMCLADGNDPESFMQELNRIYLCEENTLPCLLPPAGSTWNMIISQRRPSLV